MDYSGVMFLLNQAGSAVQQLTAVNGQQAQRIAQLEAEIARLSERQPDADPGPADAAPSAN